MKKVNWYGLFKEIPGIIFDAIVGLIWGIFDSFRNLVKDKKLHP